MSVVRQGFQKVKRIVPGVRSSPVNTDWEVGKYKNQLPCIKEDATELERRFRKWDYLKQHYPRLGLLKDDLGYEKELLYKEARKRMTEEQQQSRIFRCLRANLLQGRKDLLPEDMWTPMDAEHCYLNDIKKGILEETFERNIIKCATGDYDDEDKNFLRRKAWQTLFYKLRYFREINEMKEKLKKNMIWRKLT